MFVTAAKIPVSCLPLSADCTLNSPLAIFVASSAITAGSSPTWVKNIADLQKRDCSCAEKADKNDADHEFLRERIELISLQTCLICCANIQIDQFKQPTEVAICCDSPRTSNFASSLRFCLERARIFSCSTRYRSQLATKFSYVWFASAELMRGL